MIEITKVEAVEDEELDKLAKIAPESFGRPQKFRAIEKGCRQADNRPTSKGKRRTNVIRRYINRIYRLCLLDTLATITLAVIYVETKNEAIYAAMYACCANAFILWAFAD